MECLSPEITAASEVSPEAKLDTEPVSEAMPHVRGWGGREHIAKSPQGWPGSLTHSRGFLE